MNSKIWAKKIISSLIPPAAGGGARILLYHSVGKPGSNDRLGLRITPQQFELQIKFLIENGYYIVSLDELADSIKDNCIRRNTICITFDDGFKDNMEHAFPILFKYGIKFTVFVAPAFLDGYIKRRYEWVYLDFLDWNDVNYLLNKGGDIGCHSMNHEDLTILNNDQLHDEVILAKEKLQEKTGKVINNFSYPYGRINNSSMRFLANSGFKTACSTKIGVNGNSAELFDLKRTEITYYDSLSDFKRKLEGRYDWLAITQNRV